MITCRIVEAGPGDFMHMHDRVVHAFRNDSSAPARMLVTCVPAGLENYFRDIGTLTEKYSRGTEGAKGGQGGAVGQNQKPSVSPEENIRAIEVAQRYGLTYPNGFCVC